MKVVVIDNYDSFTYNLVQYLGELGCDLHVYRNDQVSLNQIDSMNPDRIVISPGPGRPRDAGISVDLITRFAGKLPILGVCLGHQAIAEAFGGNIIRAPELKHGKTSLIYHQGDSILSDLPSPLEATRYHSLMVRREDLPDCLLVNAWTREGLVMGLRHRQHDILGVQFHPESILTPLGKKVLKNFLCLKNSPAK